MKYVLAHVSDLALGQGLRAAVQHEREATARLLAHIAEFDARQLYRQAACPSMFVYCVRELGFSEDAAARRIAAARTAREFPALFEALADGRLHLTGVGLLAPHLTAANAAELIAAVSRRSRAEIEAILAARFPRPEWAAVLQESRVSQGISPAPARVDSLGEHAPARSASPADLLGEPLPAATPARPHDRVTPVSAEHFALQATLDRETVALLRQAQALLGRAVAPGDLGTVLRRAFESLVREQLKKKLGAGGQSPRGSKRSHHVASAVKWAVWERDAGRCTFGDGHGRRCDETHDLEFDHVIPVARGGDSSPGNLRLRCPAHNQWEAEKAYGRPFMQAKRNAAKTAAEAARAHREIERETARRESEQRREAESAEREAMRALDLDQREAARAAREAARAHEREQRLAEAAARRAQLDANRHARDEARAARDAARSREREQITADRHARDAARAETQRIRDADAAARAKAEELVPWLRSLGCNRAEALAAAAHAAHLPDAPLEQRVLAAVRSLGPRNAKRAAPCAASAA